MAETIPGPWSVTDAGPRGIHITASYGNATASVAKVYRTTRTRDIEVIRGKARALATAHLIAAAPEMLAALDSLIDLCNRIPNYSVGCPCLGCQAIDSARAARARARGEQP